MVVVPVLYAIFYGAREETPAAPHFERFMGLSFVTLTTLGYGNIVPTSPRADSLATAEAMVGQIYLTALVARPVALQLSQSGGRGTRDGGEEESKEQD